MKIGDKVRFLSEVGGGRVAGFQGKDIVLVEDADGFEVPMRVNEVVVVGDEDYDTRHVVETKKQIQAKEKQGQPNAAVSEDPADRPITFKAPVEERKGGDRLSAYLAYVPIDVKELTQTRFEAYFVNDSNYYLRYVYMTAEGSGWRVRSMGEVEPNTKEYVEEFGREDLNGLEHVCLQVLAYKKEKAFLLKPAVEVQLRVDPVKFYKLHTFQENDFFEQPALVYTIVENDKVARPLVIDAKQLKSGMYAKGTDGSQKSEGKHGDIASPLALAHGRHAGQSGNGPLVVDLHADELLDTTAGMSPSDILNYQLDVFRKTLKEYEGKKGTKIVFIHGKGEGVLRRALVNELQYRYKTYQYQDASFQEYGYGATQVTIK